MSMPRDGIVPTLAELAADGDQDALARIMAAHDSDMTRICMVICGNPGTAREAVQAAWPIAWRKLGSLRDPDRLRPWLMSVAANEARKIMRADRRRFDRESRLTATRPEDPADRAEYMDLARAVGLLDADERRLVALRYVAGLTSPEIAREVGGTAASVRGRLARAVARLRRELGDG
ncbi:MAG TPA: sigma-70 family RNA polymerase sigma factor [Candidatus Limnocylindria bacterium]